MTAHQPKADKEVMAAHNFTDPYDAMSDDEFDIYMARLFDAPQGPTRSITVRMPETLLVRLQRIAVQRHMPYQRLMKRILEESVVGLERRAAPPARPHKGKPKARS